MKIEFDKESSIVTLIPKKLYKQGYDLAIAFCDNFVCFSITDGAKTKNVQVSYEEWYQLKRAIQLLRR